MVAAYIVGINISEGEFGLRFKHVRVCGKPDQTGCALQWNAVEPGANLDAVAAAYQKSFIATYGDSAPGRMTLCVNPVTFDRSKPNSLSAQSKGAVPGALGYGSLLPLRPGAVAVRCDHGLAVSYLDPLLNLKALPGGALHYHDIGLFYADVRANAVLRTTHGCVAIVCEIDGMLSCSFMHQCEDMFWLWAKLDVPFEQGEP